MLKEIFITREVCRGCKYKERRGFTLNPDVEYGDSVIIVDAGEGGTKYYVRDLLGECSRIRNGACIGIELEI